MGLQVGAEATPNPSPNPNPNQVGAEQCAASTAELGAAHALALAAAHAQAGGCTDDRCPAGLATEHSFGQCLRCTADAGCAALGLDNETHCLGHLTQACTDGTLGPDAPQCRRGFAPIGAFDRPNPNPNPNPSPNPNPNPSPSPSPSPYQAPSTGSSPPPAH